MALTTNLVAYWKLDESSGDAADSVGSSTLTNVGTTTYAAAKINNGAVLNGSSQYYTSADSAALSVTGNFSLSLWANFSALPGSGSTAALYAKSWASGGNLSMLVQLDNTGGTYGIRVRLSANGTAVVNKVVGTLGATSTSTWYHYVVAYTASTGTVEVFKNGSSIGSDATFGTSIYNGTDGLVIGAEGDFSNKVAATLDEIGLWSRVLTGDEVSLLYSGGSGISYPFYVISASAGTFTLTGVSAALTQGYPLVASTGAFTLAGNPATLRVLGWVNRSRPASTWTSVTRSNQ